MNLSCDVMLGSTVLIYMVSHTECLVKLTKNNKFMVGVVNIHGMN